MVFGSAVGDELFQQNATQIFGVSTKASKYAESGLDILSKNGAKTISIAYSTVSSKILG